MTITEIYIQSFGTLEERVFSLSNGLNVIYGCNESGKTSLAYFIKFIFYGFSGKASEKKLSEKERFINWHTGQAGGYLMVEKDGHTYRVERSIRQVVSMTSKGERKVEYSGGVAHIIDVHSSQALPEETIPGIFFFGMEERDFLRSVFVDQVSGSFLNADELMETMENLLITGNETTTSQDALKKLDNERRRILHKSDNGGALYEAKKALGEAEEIFLRSKENAVAVVDTKEAVKRLDEQLTEKQAEKERYQAIYHAYDVVTKKRLLDEYNSLSNQVQEMEQLLDGDAEADLDRGFVAKLEQVVSGLDHLEKTIGEKELFLMSLDKKISSMAPDTYALDQAEEEIQKMKQGQKKKKAGIIWFVMSLLLMIASLSAGVLYYYSNVLFYALGGAALFMALSIVFLVMMVKGVRRVSSLEKKWGVSVKNPLWMNEITEKNKASIERKKADDERFTEEEKLRIVETQKQRLCDAAMEETRFVEQPDDTVEERLASAIDYVKKHCEKREKIVAQRDQLKAEASVLLKQLKDCNVEELLSQEKAVMSTQIGIEAAALSSKEAENMKRNLDFYEKNVPMLMQKILEKRTLLSQLTANYTEPDVAEQNRARLQESVDDLQEQYESITLAIQTMTEASTRMRQSVLPRVAKKTGEYLNAFSKGKYELIGADQSWRLSFFDGESSHSVEAMSVGTKELVYLSLRLAIMAVLENDEKPLSVFDEAFASVDDERLNSVMSFLNRSEQGQVLAFSCRVAEKESAASLGATIISM